DSGLWWKSNNLGFWSRLLQLLPNSSGSESRLGKRRKGKILKQLGVAERLLRQLSGFCGGQRAAGVAIDWIFEMRPGRISHAVFLALASQVDGSSCQCVCGHTEPMP